MVDDTEIRGGPLRAAVSNLQFSILNEFGGEGGIRTHVPLARQDAFEAPPLRPLRYLSAEVRLSRALKGCATLAKGLRYGAAGKTPARARGSRLRESR